MEIVQSGKTTGLILRALGESSLNPGQPILFVDHFRNDQTGNRYFARRIKEMVAQLNLRFDVKIAREGVFITSLVHGSPRPSIPSTR